MWIDAICINQSSNAERNIQVSKMAEIYSRANNVCIWLGDSDATREKAMDFISFIIDIPNLDKVVSDASNLPQWLAFATLLKSRWFSRRWVIQEIALARNATVHYRNKEVNWIDFADAIAHFVTKVESIERVA